MIELNTTSTVEKAAPGSENYTTRMKENRHKKGCPNNPQRNLSRADEKDQTTPPPKAKVKRSIRQPSSPNNPRE